MSRDEMTQFNVRMPRELAAQLRQRAEVEDRSLAHTLRRAILQYLAAAPLDPESETRG